MAIDLSLLHGPTSQRLRAEGRAEGRTEGTARALLLLLDQRGVDLPDDARERIADSRDLDILDTWLSRALTVTSAEELFVDG